MEEQLNEVVIDEPNIRLYIFGMFNCFKLNVFLGQIWYAIYVADELFIVIVSEVINCSFFIFLFLDIIELIVPKFDLVISLLVKLSSKCLYSLI